MILERGMVSLDRSHRRAIYNPCGTLRILKNGSDSDLPPPPPPCPFWTEPVSFTPCLSHARALVRGPSPPTTH